MTGAERSRRSRSLRALRRLQELDEAAAAEALVEDAGLRPPRGAQQLMPIQRARPRTQMGIKIMPAQIGSRPMTKA